MIRREVISFVILLFINIIYAKHKLNSVVLISNVERCKENPGVWEAHYSKRKYNRTMTVINANMTFESDLDDSLKVYFQMSRWSDGGWKKNFVNIERNKACTSTLFIVPELVKLLLTEVGTPVKCPIPKGVYAIEHFPAFIPVPNLIRNMGTFLTEYKLIDPIANITKLCMRLTTVHGDAD